MNIISVPSTNPPTSRQFGLFASIWVVALIAALIATAIDLVIATVATPIVYAPPDYASFMWTPILVGCLLGAFGAAIVLTRIRRTAKHPIRAFLITSAIVLLISYTLPIMPIVNPLPRFAGANWGIAFTLMIMHTVTATIIVSSLLMWHRLNAVHRTT